MILLVNNIIDVLESNNNRFNVTDSFSKCWIVDTDGLVPPTIHKRF